MGGGCTFTSKQVDLLAWVYCVDHLGLRLWFTHELEGKEGVVLLFYERYLDLLVWEVGGFSLSICSSWERFWGVGRCLKRFVLEGV